MCMHTNIYLFHFHVHACECVFTWSSVRAGLFLRYLKYLLYTQSMRIESKRTIRIDFWAVSRTHTHTHTFNRSISILFSRSVSVSLATFPIHFLSPSSSSFTDIYWFSCNCCSTVVCLLRVLHMPLVFFFSSYCYFCCCLVFSILLSFNKKMNEKERYNDVQSLSLWLAACFCFSSCCCCCGKNACAQR